MSGNGEDAVVSPAPATSASAPLREKSHVGRVLNGRYTLTKKLGAGAMGQVYVATQHDLGRDVAIKLVDPREYQDPEGARLRFTREGTVLAQMNHPGIVRVIDLGRDQDGYLYLVMELLQGQTLDDFLWRCGTIPVSMPVEDGDDVPGKALDFSQAVVIIRAIAQALIEVHGHKVLHRDLKPGNIMIVRDPQTQAIRPVLIDFGLVKDAPTRQAKDAPDQGATIIGPHVTLFGQVFGTLSYMPPEQLAGQVEESTEFRVDLYAIGCIFYHLLTGFPPYEDAPEIRRASSPDKPASLLFAAWGGIHFNKERGVRELLPVTRLRPDVPEWIDLFFRKALAREPKNRFQTAQDFLRDLDACLESTRLTPPLAEPKPGHFVFGGVATVLLMLVLVGVWRLNHPAGPVATSVDTPASPSIPDVIVPAPNGLALATPITVPEPPDAESPAGAADPSDAAAPVEDAPSVPDAGRRPRSSRRHRDVPTGPRCGGIDPHTGLRIPCL